MPTSESEKYIQFLTRRSFFSPWVQPNLFYKKGKELADVIVRFGDNLLIVSDKSRDMDYHITPTVAWGRWAKAIRKAEKQIEGAVRSLSRQGAKLYLDSACQVEAPDSFYGVPKNVYRIITIHGCGLSAQKHFGSRTSSLMQLVDKQGLEPKLPFMFNPFLSGEKNIYHVLDDFTIPVIFSMFDTGPDLIDYLSAKEKLFRSIPSIAIHGEEEIVREYLETVDEENIFSDLKNSIPEESSDLLIYDADYFSDILYTPRMTSKREADKPSYILDSVINGYADEAGEHPDEDLEMMLKGLASLRRNQRRQIGSTIEEYSRKAVDGQVHARTHLSNYGTNGETFAVVVLLYCWDDIDGVVSEDAISISTAYACLTFSRFEMVNEVCLISIIETSEMRTGRQQGMSHFLRQDLSDEDIEIGLGYAKETGLGNGINWMASYKGKVFEKELPLDEMVPNRED